MPEARRLDAAHLPRQGVGGHVRLGHLHRHRVDVAGDHRVGKHPRRSHRQHRGAAADIGHAAGNEAFLQQRLQRLQTAQRGAVVAGAEGHRGLDQQPHRAHRHLVRIVAAMNEEPPGNHRGKLSLHMSNPVHLGQFRHGKGPGPEGRRQQRQRRLVGRFGEIAAHLPLARAVLELEHPHAGGLGRQLLHGLTKRPCGIAAGKGRQGRIGGHGILRMCFRGVGPRAFAVKPGGRLAQAVLMPAGQLTPVPPMPQ